MPKAVRGYLARDGSFHETEEKAVARDAEVALADLTDRCFGAGVWSMSRLLKWAGRIGPVLLAYAKATGQEIEEFSPGAEREQQVLRELSGIGMSLTTQVD